MYWRNECRIEEIETKKIGILRWEYVNGVLIWCIIPRLRKGCWERKEKHLVGPWVSEGPQDRELVKGKSGACHTWGSDNEAYQEGGPIAHIRSAGDWKWNAPFKHHGDHWGCSGLEWAGAQWRAEVLIQRVSFGWSPEWVFTNQNKNSRLLNF